MKTEEEAIGKQESRALRAFNDAMDFAKISKNTAIEISGCYYAGIYHLCFGFRHEDGKIYSTTNVMLGD